MNHRSVAVLVLASGVFGAGVALVASYQIWGVRPPKPEPIPPVYSCDAEFQWNDGHTGAIALRDEAPCFEDSDVCADFDSSTREDGVQRREGCRLHMDPVSCFKRRRNYRWKTESICFASMPACRREEVVARKATDAMAVLSGCELK